MHTRMYAGFGGERIERPLSEFLEHLASDNGADMHKYNTLYTHRLIMHVLTPESALITVYRRFYSVRNLLLPRKASVLVVRK